MVESENSIYLTRNGTEGSNLFINDPDLRRIRQSEGTRYKSNKPNTNGQIFI